MKKILLVCNAGMSTSMLVQRMEKAAEADGIDAKILALPITDAANQLDEWDVIMLGPQVRHELKGLKSKTTTPVEVIEMRDYGMMNGENVLKAAIKVIDGK